MRREVEGDLSTGGHEGNGVWHLGFVDCISDLLCDSRNYDPPSSAAQRHSKPSSDSWVNQRCVRQMHTYSLNAVGQCAWGTGEGERCVFDLC